MGAVNKDHHKMFKLKPWNRGIPDKEILDDIRHVAESLDLNTIKYQDYEKLGRVSCHTVEKRFGSWNNALSRAGLQIQRYMNISEEKLFENLEQVWIKLGRQPRRHEVTKPLSLYGKGTYEKRFGTWRKALEEFVNYINLETNESETDKKLPSKISSTYLGKRTARQPNLRLRFKVMLQDNFKCRYCGKSPATHPNVELQVDHIVPWSDEGETVLDNLQTLCMECNQGKSNLKST